jgi:hypothetical protein
MRMVEIIRCKCGNIFAACELGHHEDYEWKSDVQENLTKGCTVERISINDLEFKKCVCPSEKKEDKPTPEKKEEETQEGIEAYHSDQAFKFLFIQTYLRRMHKAGVTEFRLSMHDKGKGIIHPMNQDGETLDFTL